MCGKTGAAFFRWVSVEANRVITKSMVSPGLLSPPHSSSSAGPRFFEEWPFTLFCAV
jgi:hypothetical protein